MEQPSTPFVQPGLLDWLGTFVIDALVRVGVGPSHMRLLEVRGRKSGRIFPLPVDLLDQGGLLFLVAPRGRTQWVRNAEVQREVTLRRGKDSARFQIRHLTPEQLTTLAEDLK